MFVTEHESSGIDNMNDEHESKRQMFHHYMGHYLFGLESSLQESGIQEVQERRERIVQQLRNQGDFDLATRCLVLIDRSDFSTIEGITKFREKYGAFVTECDPKDVEFNKVLAKLRAQREKSG